MIIKVYKNWKDWPEGPTRSFKVDGQSFIRLDTRTMTSGKIMQRLAFRHKGKVNQKANWLVLLTDKDYENCLTGTGPQIKKFVTDCLVDEGYMRKSLGRSL